jgi:hypothetical protein
LGDSLVKLDHVGVERDTRIGETGPSVKPVPGQFLAAAEAATKVFASRVVLATVGVDTARAGVDALGRYNCGRQCRIERKSKQKEFTHSDLPRFSKQASELHMRRPGVDDHATQIVTMRKRDSSNWTQIGKWRKTTTSQSP